METCIYYKIRNLTKRMIVAAKIYRKNISSFFATFKNVDIILKVSIFEITLFFNNLSEFSQPLIPPYF